MSAIEQAIATRIKQHFPDAKVQVSRWRGEDHLKLVVFSTAFDGKSRIERHRMVHAALGELLHTQIHALRVIARTPEEADKEVA